MSMLQYLEFTYFVIFKLNTEDLYMNEIGVETDKFKTREHNNCYSGSLKSKIWDLDFHIHLWI